MFFEIEVKPKKVYIAFKWNNKNIVDFKIQKSTLKLWLNAKRSVNRFQKSNKRCV